MPPASAVECHLMVLILVVLCALPFLLGDQPMSLGSAAEMGVLSSEGDASKQLVLAALYLGCAGLLAWRARWADLQGLGAGLGLLLLLCLASALWSDAPALALRRAVALSGSVLIGLYAGLRFDPNTLHSIICRFVAVVLVMSFLVALLLPLSGLDAEGRLRGVFSHKNTFGVFAGLGLVMLLARLPGAAGGRSAWLLRAGALACLLGLVLARSASPPAAAAFAGLVLLLARGPVTARGLAVVLVGLAALFGVVLPLIADSLGNLAALFGRDADFSGRTLVWAFSLDLLSRAPWLGYGYGVFWNSSAGLLFLNWAHFAVPHAHNGFLELALDVGLIGLAVMLASVASTLHRAARLLQPGDGPALAWAVALLGFHMFANLAESRLWGGNELPTVLFVATTVRINILHAEFRSRAAGMKAGLTA